MLKEIDTVTIADVYLCALINGDDTGLDDSEIKELNDWEKNLVTKYGALTYNIAEESEFAECDICGIYANCYEVTIYAQDTE